MAGLNKPVFDVRHALACRLFSKKGFCRSRTDKLKHIGHLVSLNLPRVEDQASLEIPHEPFPDGKPLARLVQNSISPVTPFSLVAFACLRRKGNERY